MTTAHPNSIRQRDEALILANRVRMRRAGVLRAVENGDLSLAAALADPAIARCTLHDVVERLPFDAGRHKSKSTVGGKVRRQPRKAKQLLARATLDRDRLVMSLTYRECAALLAELEDWRAVPQR